VLGLQTDVSGAVVGEATQLPPVQNCLELPGHATPPFCGGVQILVCVQDAGHGPGLQADHTPSTGVGQGSVLHARLVGPQAAPLFNGGVQVAVWVPPPQSTLQSPHVNTPSTGTATHLFAWHSLPVGHPPPSEPQITLAGEQPLPFVVSPHSKTSSHLVRQHDAVAGHVLVPPLPLAPITSGWPQALVAQFNSGL